MKLPQRADNIDVQQEQVITSPAKRLFVLAGPGSGKTRTLVRRIANAIYHNGCQPSRVAVISFSNAAAKEIADRLMVAGITVGYVGTLHGWCIRLLHSYGHLIGYRKTGRITIIMPEQAQEILDQVKNRLGYGKVSAKEAKERKTTKAVRIHHEYLLQIKRENMIDYDQILVDALRILQREDVHTGVDDLFVDETQDSQELDWGIYDQICERATFVGDMDQSIFGFRGARPEQFLARALDPCFSKEEQMHAKDVLRLEHNYRSDYLICQAANALIGHNTKRLPKYTYPVSKEAGDIDILTSDASRQEPVNIAGRLKALNELGVPFNEMAVLSRYNTIVDDLRNGLLEMGIPVESKAHAELPEDWPFCLNVIQLMMDRHNNILAKSYLKATRYSLTETNRASIESMKSGRSIHSILGLPDWPASLDNGLLERLTRAGVKQDSVYLVGQRMKELPQARPTLADLMADLWQPDDWADEKTMPGVAVTTIHKAKGKEYDVVILAACEEGLMPSTAKSSDIEEERRIFYVGITRARHSLTLSHCRNRFLYGKVTAVEPSRFLTEIQPT